MAKRKFVLDDYVKNTRTGERGFVTAFDLNPEVYSVKIDNAGIALWGELEMELKTKEVIRIGKVEIADLGEVKITGKDGYSEKARVRFLDLYHFEMSNVKGEFGASGSRVYANTEYEIFCYNYGLTLEAM